jgi:molybdopterin converting factor small subunit
MVRPVRVLLFASARTTAGTAALEWPVPADGLPAEELVRAIADRYPGLGRIIASSRLLRNGRYLRRGSERVRPGDELAIHPPYGGG